MVKKVVGRISLLDDDGGSDREISVELGKTDYIGGSLGGLEIDAFKKPPLVRGKGNVWVGEGIRTTRLQEGQPLRIGISSTGKNLSNIGSVEISDD